MAKKERDFLASVLVETDDRRVRLRRIMEEMETLTEDMPFYSAERHRIEKRNLGRLFRSVEDELSAMRKVIGGCLESLYIDKSMSEKSNNLNTKEKHVD